MHDTLATVSLALLGAFPWSGTSQAADAAKEPEIRISSSLVQVDVVVTDKKGHHVTNLNPEDFEVREDGRVQKVSHLAYVKTHGGAANHLGTVSGAPAQTIAIVMDDLGLSLDSVVRLRRALGSLVDGLPAGDRVGFVMTSAPAEDLEFTTDRARSRALIANLRFRPWSRDDVTMVASTATLDGHDRRWIQSSDWIGYPLSLDQRLTLQSIGVVKDTIASMKAEPGRKALVLVSQGFLVGDPQNLLWPIGHIYGDSDDVSAGLRRLGDLAVRSGVVVHALDPRGLVTTGLGAASSSSLLPPSPEDSNRSPALARTLSLQGTQATLRLLPDETGGTTVTDGNDLSSGFTSIVADLSGYYLIGYEPAEATFASPEDQPRYHKLDVSVRPRGLTTRTRKGFYGVTDEAIAAASSRP